MSWGQIVLSLLTGSGAAALFNYLSQRRTALSQRQLATAQTGQAKATTEKVRLDAAEQAVRMWREAIAKVDELTGVVTSLKSRVEQLEDFVRNVHRTAPSIGVRVSERGVLSVEPGAPILVVDDDPDITEALQLWLEQGNYQVATANDVPAALAALQRQWPAVVIIDLYLGGTTCLPVVQAIRAATTVKPAQIITTTGANDQATLAMIAKIDPVQNIPKPLDLTKLDPIISTALAKRETLTTVPDDAAYPDA